MPFPPVPEHLVREFEEMRRPPGEQLRDFVSSTLPRFLDTTPEASAERYHPSLRDRALRVYDDVLEALAVAALILERNDCGVSASAALPRQHEAAWGLFMLDKTQGELEWLETASNDVAH